MAKCKKHLGRNWKGLKAEIPLATRNNVDKGGKCVKFRTDKGKRE